MGQKHSTFPANAVESQQYNTKRTPMGTMRQPQHWTNNQNTYYENFNAGVSDPTLQRAQAATQYLGLSNSSLQQITRPPPRTTPDMVVRNKTNLDPRYANGLASDTVANSVSWNMVNSGIDTSRTSLQLVDQLNADQQKLSDVRSAQQQLHQTYVSGPRY